MGLVSGLGRILHAAAEKLSPTPGRVVRAYQAGRSIAPDVSLERLGEAYRRSSLIHSCIRELATSAAEPQLRAFRDGDPVDDGSALDLLITTPHPRLTLYELTERIVTDLHVYGESALHKRRSGAGLPRELWPLRPDYLQVIPGSSGEVLRYEYGPGGADKPRVLPPEDVVHIVLPNPTNEFRGLSPTFVLLAEGLLDRHAIAYLMGLLTNGGWPSMAITSPSELTPDERAQIETEFVATYGAGSISDHGTTGFGRPIVLSHGATIAPVGFAPGQMELAGLFDIAESRICSVYGVPALLVGARVAVTNSGAYGTPREARRSFWQETLSPLYERLSQALTLQVAREFGTGFELRYDTGSVLALQEVRSQVIEDAANAYGRNAITRDEMRARMGERPLDADGPVWFADTSSTAAPTINELTLGVERAARVADAATANLLRARIAETLGAPPPAPLTVEDLMKIAAGLPSPTAEEVAA